MAATHAALSPGERHDPRTLIDRLTASAGPFATHLAATPFQKQRRSIPPGRGRRPCADMDAAAIGAAAAALLRRTS